MISKKTFAIAALLLALTCFGFKGCSEKQKQDFEKNVRTAVRVGATAAVEVSAELKSYCRAELLKPESCAKALPRAEKIAEIGQRADKFLKDHPKLNAENRDELLGILDDTIKELDALEADGVIEFKDPDKRRKFLLGVALGRSGIRIARVALQEIPAEPAPEGPPQ